MLRLACIASVLILALTAGCSTKSGVGTPPATGNRTVTLADSGKTIELRTGESFLLKLGGPPPVWSATIDDPNILSRVPNIAVVQGAQGIYRAHAPGQTVMHAVGTYPCRQETPPCMTPDQVFQVTIDVRPGN